MRKKDQGGKGNGVNSEIDDIGDDKRLDCHV